MKLLNTKKNSFEKSFNLILNSKRSQAKDNDSRLQKLFFMIVIMIYKTNENIRQT